MPHCRCSPRTPSFPLLNERKLLHGNSIYFTCPFPWRIKGLSYSPLPLLASFIQIQWTIHTLISSPPLSRSGWTGWTTHFSWLKYFKGSRYKSNYMTSLTKSESVIIRLSGTICIAEEEEEGRRNPSLLFTPRKELINSSFFGASKPLCEESLGPLSPPQSNRIRQFIIWWAR